MTSFDVDGATLAEVFANPMAFASGGRVVPLVQSGTARGFKVFAIKPGSLYALAGLENGDAVTTLAGFAMSDAAQALEAYTVVSKTKPGTISVEIERGGKPMTLVYTLR